MHTGLHGSMLVKRADSNKKKKRRDHYWYRYLPDKIWEVMMTLDSEILSTLASWRTKLPANVLLYRAIQDIVLPSGVFPLVAGDCRFQNE